MDDQHHHNYKELSGKNLLIATVLNLTITAAEFVGGFLANSLALISDAVHNLSDGIAILIAYIAYRLGRRGSSKRQTFGFKRAEILAALLNSLVLIVIFVYLVVEAVKHLLNPEPINGVIMFTVATIGLIANVAAVVLLRKDSKKNLNIKAAYLHLLGDTISSVAVIAGGILIMFFKIYWLDPVITILIGAYILKETYKILKRVIEILMQAAPPEIDLSEIKKSLEEISSINNIHHVHIWNLSDKEVHFECHVDLDKNIRLSATEEIRCEIENILRKNFGIEHITVQFENGACDSKELIFNS